MSKLVLDQELLKSENFWDGKDIQLPNYDRTTVPVKSICFSAGRMAYGHTADILQDILNEDKGAGLIVGIKTRSLRGALDLAVSDYMMTQLIFGNNKGEVSAKVQGAIKQLIFIDSNKNSSTWQRLMQYAKDPMVQWASINAPEGVYGVNWNGGEFAEPIDKRLIEDMKNGTVETDPAKWTAFALERFKANLKFAMVSCTNFSSNGHYTKATLKTIAKAWEDNGFAPKGFVDYLSDPKMFGFPNTMIDRIAVSADDNAKKVLNDLDIVSDIVVTEQARYWAVEDVFPAGRPKFENAEGVFMCPDYNDVKRYEDMKLRILNMSHSVIAGIGVLLGYRGNYGIYRAMQDGDIKNTIEKIIEIVLKTIESPKQLDPKDFANDTITRLCNPNIPDDPMRIALNGSTKLLPRFLDTYYEAQKLGLNDETLDLLLLPVAGFLRYTLGIDDEENTFDLEDDPIKDILEDCGKNAVLGQSSSASVFDNLISNSNVMGKDLFSHGDTGNRLKSILASMLAGKGAVRNTLKDVLSK